MPETIIVTKISEATLFVESSERVAREIWNHFSKYAPNYKWHKLFKAKIWDGKIHFFTAQRHLPIGLLDHLIQFARFGGYDIEIPFKTSFDIDESSVWKFIKTLNLPKELEIRDYQFQAIYDTITKKRLNISSVTSSGKSLIMYVLARYFEATKKQLLIVVPLTNLVEQLYSDFIIEYGWKEGQQKIQRIYSEYEKEIKKPIVISTFQSLCSKSGKPLDMLKNKKAISNINAIMVDECLHPDTKISLSNGREKKIKNIKEGDEVLSYNEDSKKIENKKVIKKYKNISNNQKYKIILENDKEILITGNHKVLTSLKIWKRADELNEGESIIFL